MPVGKTSFIVASDEAASSVSGQTYITNIIATRISTYFVDLVWGVGDSAIGVTRYNSNNNTFSTNKLTKLNYTDFQITKTLNAHELKGQNVTISSSYTVVSAKAISCSPTLGYVNNVIVIPGYHVGSNCWISLFNATTENVPEQTYTIRVFYY